MCLLLGVIGRLGTRNRKDMCASIWHLVWTVRVGYKHQVVAACGAW